MFTCCLLTISHTQLTFIDDGNHGFSILNSSFGLDSSFVWLIVKSSKIFKDGTHVLYICLLENIYWLA